VYEQEVRAEALRLVQRGHSLNAVSKQLGMSRAAIRSWRHPPEPLRWRSQLCVCSGHPPGEQAAYAYLLGLYLGDGCISRGARAHALRIACSDAWPGLIDACQAAISAIRPDNRVCRTHKQGCVMVTSYSTHWPCLFPQHGPGKKHDRRIELHGWQQEIVDAHPWELLRGLVHSDGCRVTNWTTRVVAGGERRRYEYPR
jgi:hypothetical protein